MMQILVLGLFVVELIVLYLVKMTRTHRFKFGLVLKELRISILEQKLDEPKKTVDVDTFFTKESVEKFEKMVDTRRVWQAVMNRCNESIVSFILGQMAGVFFGLLISNLATAASSGTYSLEAVMGGITKIRFFLSSVGVYHLMEFMYHLEYQYEKLSFNDF